MGPGRCDLLAPMSLLSASPKDSWTWSDSFNVQGPPSPRGQELGTWLLKLSTVAARATRGRPLPGPESGLSSNTWKWIVQEDTPTDKTKDFIGKGVESSRVREPTWTALHMAHCLRVCGGGGVSFWVDSGQSSCLCPYLVWLWVLPSGPGISQPRWVPPWGFLEGWQNTSLSWSGPPVVRLVVHANDYSCAWPRRLVVVTGFLSKRQVRRHKDSAVLMHAQQSTSHLDLK